MKTYFNNREIEILRNGVVLQSNQDNQDNEYNHSMEYDQYEIGDGVHGSIYYYPGEVLLVRLVLVLVNGKESKESASETNTDLSLDPIDTVGTVDNTELSALNRFKPYNPNTHTNTHNNTITNTNTHTHTHNAIQSILQSDYGVFSENMHSCRHRIRALEYDIHMPTSVDIGTGSGSSEIHTATATATGDISDVGMNSVKWDGDVNIWGAWTDAYDVVKITKNRTLISNEYKNRGI